MSNVCFYPLIKLICSKFQLSTSIIVAAIVKNNFWPFWEVPLKWTFLKKKQIYVFILWWNLYIPIFSFLRQLLWLLSSKTSFAPWGTTPEKGQKKWIVKLTIFTLNILTLGQLISLNSFFLTMVWPSIFLGLAFTWEKQELFCQNLVLGPFWALTDPKRA